MSLLPIALHYLQQGISVIPCDIITKKPTIKWKPYIETLPHPVEMIAWFKRGNGSITGISAISGPVSGNLEIIDFDDRALFQPWQTQVACKDNSILNNLVMAQTQSGGFHIYYRAPVVTGNKKLARNEDGKTLIETRGTGGYAIVPPSNKYHWINHDFTALPNLSMREKVILVNAAKSFNKKDDLELIFANAKEPVMPDSRDGLRPGDIYNLYGDVYSLLIKYGWKYLYNHSETSYWQRPGKRRMGISAVFNFANCNKLHVFSTSAYPLEAETNYTPFALYTIYECGGDFRFAAATLAAQGFVDGAS